MKHDIGGELAPTETSRYGPLFWVGLLVGWGIIAFGLRVLLVNANLTRPENFTLYFLGLIVAHDFVLVPLVAIVGVVISRAVPPTPRRFVQGALIVAGVLILVAYPMVRGFGKQPDNPSLLPRNYDAGIAIAVGITFALAWLLFRRVRPAKPPREGPRLGGDLGE